MWDILVGAFLGATAGAVFLGVGLFGAVTATLAGGHIALPGTDDLYSAEYYVSTFAVAGACLGAAKPLLRTRVGMYAGYAIAGGFIMIALAAMEKGGVTGLATSDVVGMAVIGGLFGCAAAWGWNRNSG